MPLTSSHVIPPGWAAKHGAVSEDAMTARCRVTRRATTGPAQFDAQTGRSVYPDPQVIYAGPCRVTHTAHQGQAPVVGEKDTPIGGYDLAMPLSAPVLDVGDVAVIQSATDPSFAGAKLQIVAAHGGSLVWQRTYQCDEWTATAR